MKKNKRLGDPIDRFFTKKKLSDIAEKSDFDWEKALEELKEKVKEHEDIIKKIQNVIQKRF